MTKKYGPTCCHLLRINSSISSQLPDPWVKIIEQRYRGIESGLERARHAILEKSNTDLSYDVKFCFKNLKLLVVINFI